LQTANEVKSESWSLRAARVLAMFSFMSRRSTPQHKTDHSAYPVHVRVLVPELGFGPLYDRIHRWLDTQLGRGEYAQAGAESILGDAVAFLFRSTDHADAFMLAHPELVLADGTMSVTYTSPHNPFGRTELTHVCNLYNQTKAQDAMRRLFDPLPLIDRLGNLKPQPEIYPDYLAPVVRESAAGRELVMARWGLPTPPQYLIGKKTDRGVTNVRNAKSPHWRRWLGPENRCLVPFDAFAEPKQGGGNAWFRIKDDRTAFFAGLFVPGWTSVRKVKDGETTDDLYGFLTTEPNAEVAPIHPKAMPVILTKADEWQAWLKAPWNEAQALQRPLADGELTVS
jgi:putative SOS response-associated peptidase YedK